MPEIPLCIHCRKPIDQNSEDYVVTNKDQVKSLDDWLYAHALCQDARWDDPADK